MKESFTADKRHWQQFLYEVKNSALQSV